MAVNFATGTTLGTFVITGLLGKGGMGEVYRARDLKLGREVAIKVLPAALASDAGYLSRFEREARTLASVDHPNIAAIYDFVAEQNPDRGGGASTIHLLVLQLVEGETLADRIRRGPIPVPEALPIFIQIARALDAAHQRGIVHRDLKPANIKITAAGDAKVLDFGIAIEMARTEIDPDAPTTPLSLPPLTREGAIIGTPNYMSPEHARGKLVDRRTDVWSFGCCVFEALSGVRSYGGDTVADIIATIIERDPDWSKLPTSTPQELQSILRRCLEKDVSRRYSDFGEIAAALEAVHDAVRLGRATRIRRGPAHRPRSVALALGMAAVAAALAGAALYLRAGNDGGTVAPADKPPAATYTAIALPADQPLARPFPADTGIAISPDGASIVYGGMAQDSQRVMYLLRIGRLESTIMDGSIGADRPFFSPDGEWIGFVGYTDSRRMLVKVSTAGGAPFPLTPVPMAFPANWADDGSIVFTPGYGRGLMRIASDGGEPEQLTVPAEDETGHAFPFVLPGSRAVLYTAFVEPTVESARIMLMDVASGTSRMLFEHAGHAKYIDTGHIIYSQRGALMAAPFDLDALDVSGPSFDVTEPRMVEPSGVPTRWTISNSGTLAYVPLGVSEAEALTLSWVDLDGTKTELNLPPGHYSAAQVAPNGRDALLVQYLPSEEPSLWLLDTERLSARRLNRNNSPHLAPLWMADGYHYLFSSTKTGDWAIHMANLDEPDASTVVARGEGTTVFPRSLLPGEKTLLFEAEFPNQMIFAANLQDEPSRRVLLKDEGHALESALSPDGNWIAYTLLDGTQDQVFIRTYPDMKWKTQISVDGGSRPQWSPDGKTLYFLGSESNDIMAAPLRFDPEPITGAPRVIFGGAVVSFDVHPSGDRFLVINRPSSGVLGGREIVVVQNWFAEVMRRQALQRESAN